MRKKFKPETHVSRVLAEELRGRTEVSTPVGSIDVLTESELIEVKKLKHWKSALGQLIAYGMFYPDHALRLHLVGMPSPELELIIAKACQKIGATISIQDEIEYSIEELEEMERKSQAGFEVLKNTVLASWRFSAQRNTALSQAPEHPIDNFPESSPDESLERIAAKMTEIERMIAELKTQTL